MLELNYQIIKLSELCIKYFESLSDSNSDNFITCIHSTDEKHLSRTIHNEQGDEIRWDILGKSLSKDGKVLIGARIRAKEPFSISMMSIDL